MEYKKKAALLLAVISVLAIALILSFIFDSERVARRSSSYTWLDSRFLPLADRIEIRGQRGTITLLRKNNIWVMPDAHNVQIEYPVKQIRVDDMLAALSRRANYPVRSTSREMERKGFGDDSSRITVYGGAGLPLLDMLIGYTDLSGGEVFLRKIGQSEIRSGADVFTMYTENDKTFWYDLRLFPDLTAAMVQRVHLISATEELILRRSGNNWINENTGAVISNGETYLRSLLDAQGEDFVSDLTGFEVFGSIVLELGDGSIVTIYLGQAGNRQLANIRGSRLFYLLGDWTVKRIWPDNWNYRE